MNIKIGETEYPGKLPWIPRMMRVVAAHQVAVGMQFNDDESAKIDDDGNPTFGKPDEDALAMVTSAALGLALNIPTEVAPLHEHETMFEYGNAVMGEMLAAGHSPADFYKAGSALIDLYYASIPRGPSKEAVEEAEDFSDTASGDGPLPDSNSVSDDAETPSSGSV